MSVKRPNNLVSFGCLHPRIVLDKTGTPITVPCRQCAYCRMHHSSVISSLGSLEALSSPNILFVTCTYSNENIPKCSYSVEDLEQLTIKHDCKDITFKVPHSKLVLFDKTTGEIYDTLLTKRYTIDYVKRSSQYYHGRFPRFFASDEIPVLKKSDASKFIKRIRTQFIRKYQTRSCFRSLYCGEYGPTTNRPHFHFLFFCSSALERARLYTLIRSSLYSQYPLWSFGRVDCKYYKGKGCGYLSSYMQGLTTLSDVHSRSVFRCFCSHSIRLGEDSLLSKFGDIQVKRPSSYSALSFIIDGKQSEHHLCPSLEASIYPRCRNFRSLSFNELFKRYCFSSEYIHRNPYIKTASQLCDYILKEIREFQDEGIIMPFYCRVFGYQLSDINTENARNIIYRDCLISFKFFKYKPINLISSSYIKVICDYYKSKDDFYKQLDDASQGLLEELHEYTAANYFIDNKQIDTEHLGALTDYRSTQPFKDWVKYNCMRLYDASKMKKFKDFYSNKFYSNKVFYIQLKNHSNE